MYNYQKLRGRIRECFGTEGALANAMGVNRATLSQKLSNKKDFSQQDIMQMAQLLGINSSEIGEYFFTHKVAI